MGKIKYLLYGLTIVPILLIILGYIYPSVFFGSQDSLRTFIEGYGVLAPLVFIFLQILQVVLTPLSHYSVGLLGGYLFGPWVGFVYNWSGRVIGTLIAFYLARTFGRKIVTKLVKLKTMKKYDTIFEKGKFILFLIYFLPLFPDDELSYLAGVSSLKAKMFIPLMLLGHVGGSFGLAYVGAGFSMSDPIFIIFSVLTILAAILFVLFYKKFYKQ